MLIFTISLKTSLLNNSEVQNFIVETIRGEYVYQETATFKKGYE
jgi:hypothetical protein